MIPRTRSLRQVLALIAALATLSAGAAPRAAASPALYALKGEWQQGALIFGHTDSRAHVSFEGRSLRVSPRGDFVFGFDRDAKGIAELRVAVPGRAEVVKREEIRPRRWPTQRIEGLPPEQVNPPPEVEARIVREQQLLAAAHARDSEAPEVVKSLQWPARGRISGTFGSQRILNGTPKAPHYGVDLALPEGTPVRAPAAGTVSLAEPDLYFTGGTLIIDHGYGLSSILVHLSKLRIRLGQKVAAGEVVADSGMTGRATGPHLHWGLYWFDAHVDPMSVVARMQAAPLLH